MKFLIISFRPRPTTPKRGYALPPQNQKNYGKKTLILDLDETLVHSCFQPVEGVDIVLPVLISHKLNIG